MCESVIAPSLSLSLSGLTYVSSLVHSLTNSLTHSLGQFFFRHLGIAHTSLDIHGWSSAIPLDCSSDLTAHFQGQPRFHVVTDLKFRCCTYSLTHSLTHFLHRTVPHIHSIMLLHSITLPYSIVTHVHRMLCTATMWVRVWRRVR